MSYIKFWLAKEVASLLMFFGVVALIAVCIVGYLAVASFNDWRRNRRLSPTAKEPTK